MPDPEDPRALAADGADVVEGVAAPSEEELKVALLTPALDLRAQVAAHLKTDG